MTPAEFIARFPTLYHVAPVANWPCIKKHGLMSTAALLDLCEISPSRRAAIVAGQRRTSTEIVCPRCRRTITIRDQKPMNAKKLRACLDGMSERAWFELLNGMVFFWPDRDRANHFLDVYAEDQCLIAVSSGELLSASAQQVRLSPINSGATLYDPPRRGPDTFRALAAHPSGATVAEVTVLWELPDTLALVQRVERMHGRTATEVIYERPKP